jgi:hypothetical protein
MHDTRDARDIAVEDQHNRPLRMAVGQLHRRTILVFESEVRSWVPVANPRSLKGGRRGSQRSSHHIFPGCVCSHQQRESRSHLPSSRPFHLGRRSKFSTTGGALAKTRAGVPACPDGLRVSSAMEPFAVGADSRE